MDYFTASDDASGSWYYSPGAWVYSQNLFDSMPVIGDQLPFVISLLLNVILIVLHLAKCQGPEANHSITERTEIQEKGQSKVHHRRIDDPVRGQGQEENLYSVGCEQEQNRLEPNPVTSVQASAPADPQQVPAPAYPCPASTPANPSQDSVTNPEPSGSNKRKERSPDRFSGQGDLEDWLYHFDAIAKVNGWTEERKGVNLAVSLEEDARQVLSSLSEEEREDYSTIVQALKRRFDPDGRERAKKGDFQSRRQKDKETASEFGHALRRLARIAYPKMPKEHRDGLTLDQFIGGLSSRKMRKHVQLSDPVTLEKAITLATKFECFEESEAHRENDDRPAQQGECKEEENIAHRFMEDVFQRLMALENKSKPHSFGNAQESKIRFQPGLICFKCKGEGHPGRLCFN